jgi:predicted DNA-binding protein (MmcQ/YjbR family)
MLARIARAFLFSYSIVILRMDIEMLRNICNRLPAVTEDIKWGSDLCFCIGGKMFCVTGLSGPLQVSLKVRDEQFDVLTAKTAILPAPYLARHKWILIKDANAFSKKEWKEYIAQSYELTKNKLPKKVLRELGL